MRRIVRFLLFIVMLLTSQCVLAENESVYFYTPSDGDWTQVCTYVWREENEVAVEKPLGEWPGEQCTSMTDAFGRQVWMTKITMEKGLDEANYYIIFNNGKDEGKLQTGNLGLVHSGVYHGLDGTLGDISEVYGMNFELVATVGKRTMVLPLSASRLRNGGEYSTSLYTIGLKDDMLPGKKNDMVSCFLREKNSHKEYRPLNDAENGNFGEDRRHTLSAVNSNVVYYGTAAYTTEKSDKVFTLVKGQGVSYTFGLNLEMQIEESVPTTSNESYVTYPVLANSVSLYVNRSTVEAYQETYPDYKVGKTKDEVEDYYLIGQLSGKDDSYSTDTNQDNLMKKRIYFNPTTQEVDSVVYSLVVQKPADVDFKNLYLAFVPKSLAEDGNKTQAQNEGEAVTDWVGSTRNYWKYIIRPQVQDGYDGTAVSGCVLVAGSYKENDAQWGCGSGNQALNPLVTQSYDSYVVRFNPMTSTYRLEFVNPPTIDITRVAGKSYVRTYSTSTDLSLPADGHLRAYVVHDFVPAENTSYTGNSQGTLYLRRLQYIPAGEGVVLVSCQSDVSESKISEQLEVKYDGSDIAEDWWYNTIYKEKNEKFANYLVASLYGMTIDNGIYDEENHCYTHRNFFLNEYFNTKYYKELKSTLPSIASEQTNYIGFFRSSGKVGANKAYLQLSKEKMNFNGQITGSEKDDDNQSLAKVSMVFDDGMWKETTGISQIPVEELQGETYYYTLSGIRVVQPNKGIYIHKGKVVVLK